MNPDREIINPGLIVIDDGQITSVEEDRGQAGDNAEEWDLEDRFVLPGFVNAHAHAVAVLTRGLGMDRFQTGADPRGRAVAESIRDRTDEALGYAGARLALTDLMLSGVTTTADSQTARKGLEGASDGVLRAWSESGLRVKWYRASVDQTEIVPAHHHDDPGTAVAELDRLAGRWNSELITVGAEALALHRVSREMLETLSAWAEANAAPFAMHISYSEMAARHSLDEHGKQLLVLLSEWGLMDERFLGHHPVILSEREIAIAASCGGGFSWSPAANMLIGLSAAPVREMIDAGVRLGLGLDQPNDGHNFFETMKSGVLQQRAAAGDTAFGSPDLMLEMATIGGARALGLDNEIGSIEVGKKADLIIIDGRAPSVHPLHGALSNLVYSAGPEVVETVLVEGKTVVANHTPVSWDLSEVVSESETLLAEALGGAGL